MKIEVRITPNASKDEITGKAEDGRLRIRIQSPPVDGAANKRLVRFIAKTAGVAKSKVRIVSGERSRDKALEIDGDEKEIIRSLVKTPTRLSFQ